MNKTQMLLFFVLSGCFAIPGYSYTDVECDSYEKLVEILQQDPSAHIVLTSNITVKPSDSSYEDKRLKLLGQIDFNGYCIVFATGSFNFLSLNHEKQKWAVENQNKVFALSLFDMYPGTQLKNIRFSTNGSNTVTRVTKLEVNGNDVHAVFRSHKDVDFKDVVKDIASRLDIAD